MRLPNKTPNSERTQQAVDQRFEELVGELAWRRLPKPIRRRFAHALRPNGQVIYRGRVIQTRLNKPGWLLAQLSRLIGGPLPVESQTDQATSVVVTVDPDNGLLWTRQFARRRGWPQIIRSAKRFAGPTGLEEHIGAGIGIALRVRARADRLCFELDHLFVKLAKWTVRLPRRLFALRMLVEHIHLKETSFGFYLRIDHPRLGCLVEQLACYEDDPVC